MHSAIKKNPNVITLLVSHFPILNGIFDFLMVFLHRISVQKLATAMSDVFCTLKMNYLINEGAYMF